eukprot:8438254-Ditylum_brightwellii.AAC.1
MIARDQKEDWDETHPKAQIGSGLEYETKFARDEKGRLCDEGGTYTDAPTRLDPKYENWVAPSSFCVHREECCVTCKVGRGG